MAANSELEADIPLWKKHLIARLRLQNKCNGNSVTVSTNRQLSLSPPFYECSGRTPKTNNQSSFGIRATCNQLSPTKSASNSSEDGTSVVIGANKFVSPLTQRKLRSSKMVQERTWAVDYTSCESVDMVSENDNYSRTSDSDSSEELHYGPGIVNKLKNKYLSLALRGENNNKQRPSILNLRKATSLENMLDDVDEPVKTDRKYQTNGIEKNSTNRYRNTRRGTQDIKRARSVEAISRFESLLSPPPMENQRPKSLHEYILIGDAKEGNDKYRKPKDSEAVEIENSLFSNNYVPRVNRPKRITPVMNEREKPPADVVKQAKMIFEKRPEQRTKPPVTTGEVAAKVASYKNIIVQSKPIKKPPIKTKPVSTFIVDKKNGSAKSVLSNKKGVEEKKVKIEPKPKVDVVNKKFVSDKEGGVPKKAPRIREITKKNEKIKTTTSNEVIKDVQVEETQKEVETEESTQVKPVQLSSPIPDVSLIEFPKSENDASIRLCETPDLIMTASPVAVSTPCDKTAAQTDAPIRAPSPTSKRKTDHSKDAKNAESVTPIYCDLNSERLINNENVPFNEPLNLIINGNTSRCSPSPDDAIISQISPIPALTRRKIVSPPIRPDSTHFFDRVTEKNLINVAKSANAAKTDEKTDVLVPRKVRRPPREPETNSIVFKFTDRKDVPDYVQNDKSRTVGRIERPKVGEGGIILLPGASLDESFTDEDQEIMRYLQAPPSPCDVTFINDNILIDGKSSISQKTKKCRMRISFVDSGPDVYEYPSESSLLVDEVPSPVSPTATTPLAGHTVPMLSGSSLANYTPKSTEEFQPGVTRSIPNVPPQTTPQATQDLPQEVEEQSLFEEVEQPITFSAGTNSDMLF